MKYNAGRQRGFTLLLLVLTIMLGTGIYFLINRTQSRADSQTTQESATRASLASIDKALAAFVNNNKRLPCPASPADGAGLAAPNGAATACTAADGVVPWGTLGLRLEDTVDAWGRKISYRVYAGATGFTQSNGLDATTCNTSALLTASTIALTASGACGSLASTVVPASRIYGTQYSDFLSGKGLTVNELGTAKTTVAYVLISHGATGNGGYPNSTPATATRMTMPDAASKETANASSPVDNTYWIQSFSDNTVLATDAMHFDDIVRYKYLADLLQETALTGRDWGIASVSKSFAPAALSSWPAATTLTITLSNSGASPATLYAPLVDGPLPTGMLIASTPAASTTCAPGIVTAVAGTNTITLPAAAIIPARSGSTPGSCTISVPLTVTATGPLVNTILAGSAATTTGLLTTTIGWNPTFATATLAVSSSALAGGSNFARTTLETAIGATISGSNTNLSTINFTGFNAASFATSARDISSVQSGSGAYGIGAATTAGGGTSISTSGSEGIRFTLDNPARYFGIILLDFNIVSGNQNERATLKFYDSTSTLISTVTVQACKSGTTPANYKVDPGASYKRVDVQALNRLNSATSSSFLIGGVQICNAGTAATCNVTGYSPTYDCP